MNTKEILLQVIAAMQQKAQTCNLPVEHVITTWSAFENVTQEVIRKVAAQNGINLIEQPETVEA